VLYVHGWTDYFYNPELARFFTNAGAQFYAVDMRGIGRSLRPGHIPGFVTDLSSYFIDLDAATSFIQQVHPGLPIVVVAHSQGALTVLLWARQRRTTAAGLVLNSPWLGMPLSAAWRLGVTPVVKAMGRRWPQAVLPVASPRLYERTISADFGGEWPINDQWRANTHRPARLGWAKAVLEAHAQIARGLNLTVPILTLTSHASLIRPWWDERMTQVDVITDVRTTWHHAAKLSTHHRVVRIRGGVHDVFLSPYRIRRQAHAEVAAWLAEEGFIPPHH